MRLRAEAIPTALLAVGSAAEGGRTRADARASLPVGDAISRKPVQALAKTHRSTYYNQSSDVRLHIRSMDAPTWLSW